MNFKQSAAILLITFLMGMVAGYLFRGSPEPEIIKENITRHVPDLRLPDIQGPSLELTRQYRFIHTERVDTVERKVPVPVSFGEKFYITERQPLRIDGNTIQFQYYDPVENERGLDEYDIRRPTLGYGVYADAFWPVDHLLTMDFRPKIGVRATANVWRLQGHVGAYHSVINRDFALMAGVSYRFMGNY